MNNRMPNRLNQRQVKTESDDKRTTLTRKTMCPFSNCHANVSSVAQLCRHLYDAHGLVNQEPMRSFVLYFATFYYANSYASTCDQYAQFCSICRKCTSSTRKNAETDKTELSSDEKKSHLYSHCFLPEFYCTLCEIWIEEMKYDLHQSQTHHSSNEDVLQSGNQVFSCFQDQLVAYQKFYNDLSNGLLADFSLVPETDDEAPHKGIQSIHSFTTLIRNEFTVHEISVFVGSFYKTFCGIGHMNFVCELILAASNEKIDVCCAEVEINIKNMLFHQTASSSLACLLVRSNCQFWHSFLQVIDHMRAEISSSSPASTLIRRLLTFAPISSHRKDQLACALVSPSIDVDFTFSGQYKSYILQGVAFQHSEASLKLAKHLSLCIESFSRSQHNSHSIRYMIRTAVRNYSGNDEYKVFLIAVESNLPQLILNQFGSYVTTCLIFNAPEYSRSFIRTMTNTPRWLFWSEKRGPQRFTFQQTSDLMITALNMSPAATANNFLWCLQPNQTNELIRHSSGNNIIRQLVTIADDYCAVNFIYGHIRESNLTGIGYAIACRNIIYANRRRLNT